MPEEGIHYLPKKELLTFEEVERMVTMRAVGITKSGSPVGTVCPDHLMQLIRIRSFLDGIGMYTLHNGVSPPNTFLS